MNALPSPFMSTSFVSVIIAVGALYGFGYLVGAVLVSRTDNEFRWAWAIIRTAAGLLLTTIGFLACLVLSLPWYVAPVAFVVAAIVIRPRSAFRPPHLDLRITRDGISAGALCAAVISPIIITVLAMGTGPFPPVFYNIDTAYHLEKAHALTVTQVYPPESLSNIGIRRTYHYGSQAMAALISRSSGLPPHQSMFLIVLPLLTLGVVAAAAVAARHLAPAVPRSVTVPLLLISIPALSIPFSDTFGSQLWHALTAGDFSVRALIGEYGLWGVLSNEGPNVGGDFVIVGTIAGIAAASGWGWMLPAFLAGSALLVKTTAGIALIAGFGLMEAWRALAARRFQASPPLLMAGAVFVFTAATFFLVSFESNFQVEWAPLYHLREMAARQNLRALTFDVLWMLLPALIVMSAGIRDPERRSAPLLLLAAGPLIVVNVSRMDNVVAGGGGTGDDWFQILHAAPFLLHAFVLSFVGRRWPQLGRGRRAAVLLALALTVAPVAVAAAHYSVLILRDPESGNDFVDNRSLAAALALIPVRGTVIVTNDLRYPAGHFTRDYRQMQIPALFGHQAYAVNYAHEAVEERRDLQRLLQEPEWSDAISQAASMHHWTHLLIRKDYMHPATIPLDRIFENESYEVYRFP